MDGRNDMEISSDGEQATAGHESTSVIKSARRIAQGLVVAAAAGISVAPIALSQFSLHTRKVPNMEETCRLLEDGQDLNEGRFEPLNSGAAPLPEFGIRGRLEPLLAECLGRFGIDVPPGCAARSIALTDLHGRSCVSAITVPPEIVADAAKFPAEACDGL